jgi:hypothetical protein
LPSNYEKRKYLKPDGASLEVSMAPDTNPRILMMGLSVLPIALSLFPFKEKFITHLSR